MVNKRIFAVVFILVMFIFISSTSYALEITQAELTIQSGLSELSVRQTVSAYFVNRMQFLSGETSQINVDNIGIVNDEQAHLEHLNAMGIVLEDSSYSIESVGIYDTYSHVVAVEYVNYTKNGIQGVESVSHQLTIFLNEADAATVSSDAYAESYSEFVSCSYVMPEISTYSTSSGGSSLCIVEVAKGEIGTTETGDNITKYGEWINENGLAWCASFVSWCANQANIDTTIIKMTPRPTDMMQQFNNTGRLYYSSTYGGSYTPKVGDIVFTGSSKSVAGHVGIVESVGSSSFYVVDGNWSDKVSHHSYSFTDSTIIGYGHPNYATSGHTYTQYGISTTSHWSICINCGHESSTSAHNYPNYSYNSTYHWQECTTCAYSTAKVAHSRVSGLSTDANYHWTACTLCDVQLLKTAHTFVLISSAEGYKCEGCGYRTFNYEVQSVQDQE